MSCGDIWIKCPVCGMFYYQSYGHYCSKMIDIDYGNLEGKIPEWIMQELRYLLSGLDDCFEVREDVDFERINKLREVCGLPKISDEQRRAKLESLGLLS